jgi:hypothetical protein
MPSVSAVCSSLGATALHHPGTSQAVAKRYFTCLLQRLLRRRERSIWQYSGVLSTLYINLAATWIQSVPFHLRHRAHAKSSMLVCSLLIKTHAKHVFCLS